MKGQLGHLERSKGESIAKRAALIFLVVALAAPSTASGSSLKLHTVAPTKAQRTAILKAFGVAKAGWPCMIVGLAASNHNYGTIRYRVKRKKCQQWAWDGVNIAKHRKHNHWKMVMEGSDYSCPLARIPRRVQRDLGVCP